MDRGKKDEGKEEGGDDVQRRLGGDRGKEQRAGKGSRIRDPGEVEAGGADGDGHVPLQRGPGGDVGGHRPPRLQIRLVQLHLGDCPGYYALHVSLLPSR